jgi:glycosyltransferase involved in cell wall biosynthesis
MGLELSIVVPCYNSAATLGAQFEALARQRVRGEWEIVVVDDGSTDDTVAVIDQWRSRLPLVLVSNPTGPSSPARARNLGVQSSRGEFVLFCDADDVVGVGWAEAMQHALEEHDFVSARIEEDRLNDAAALYARGRHPEGLLYWPGGAFLPYAGSGTLGVRRALHDAVHGFDESFDHRGEDLDYCWRIQEHASIVIQQVPDAILHYRYRSGYRAILRQARFYGACEVYTYAKWSPHLPIPPHQWRSGLWAWLRVLADVRFVRDRSAFGRWIWQVGHLTGHAEASARTGVLVLVVSSTLSRRPFSTRFPRRRITASHAKHADDRVFTERRDSQPPSS